jgi:hypothetical protein
MISISDKQSAGQEGLQLHELCILDTPTDFKHSLKILVHFLQRKLVKEEANLKTADPFRRSNNGLGKKRKKVQRHQHETYEKPRHKSDRVK